uniref:Uncharacterized protein n=1 Tax=Cynoglossus semilaevis TaxID=244447 RepID=A0A3P8UTH4_CYNSE
MGYNTALWPSGVLRKHTGLVGIFILAVIVPLPVAQVTGIDRHCGFDLQLCQLHAVVENPEELF